MRLFEPKKYPSKDIYKRTSLYFSIGLAMSLSIVTVAVNWNFKQSKEVVSLGEVKDNFEAVREVPPTKQPPPPKQKKIQPKIVEVPNDEEIEEDVEVDLDITTDEESEVEDVKFEPKEEPKEEKADKIFQVVQENAQPKGGMSAFYEYVSNELKYPKEAAKNDISGKVYVQFVVEKNGELTNIKVIKGIGYGCDKEAKRILAEAPRWEPGKQRGKPVRVRKVLPITFKLMPS